MKSEHTTHDTNGVDPRHTAAACIVGAASLGALIVCILAAWLG